MRKAEPERELIRRILPWSGPAAAVAFALGFLADGSGAGWSASIGIALVTANFVASASSVAWTASTAPVLLPVIALGGFLVRLAASVVVIMLLRRLEWFSMVAFLASLVPATITLLVVEMRLLSGRLQGELWTFPNSQGARE